MKFYIIFKNKLDNLSQYKIILQNNKGAIKKKLCSIK